MPDLVLANDIGWSSVHAVLKCHDFEYW